MNEQNGQTPCCRIVLAVMAVAGMLLGTAPPAAAKWLRAHGDAANSGFADVDTVAARTAPVTIPGLGAFAPGSGPVVAADGTVYLGNEQGRLIALKPDGKPFWSRDLFANEAVKASPAIGADGSIYVIGVTTAKDSRRKGRTPRLDLHKYIPGGGYSWHMPFPEHGGVGITTAPPNIWKSGNVEAVMVPVLYKANFPGGYEVRLIAFSTSGGVLADIVVTTFVSEVSGSSDSQIIRHLACLLPPHALCLPGGFTAPNVPDTSGPGDRLPEDTVPPLPGVAIYTFPGGGVPWVIVTDQINDVVGYTFAPEGGFTENFRLHDTARAMRSAPTMLADSHSMVGTDTGAVFAGPSGIKLAPVTSLGSIYGAPTRTADGRAVLVSISGRVSVLQGTQVLSTIQLPGQSIAPAAASRTHVFVSTTGAFASYVSSTMQEAGLIPWVGGGLSSPAIGPQGHVYALASNILFVFPPPSPTAQLLIGQTGQLGEASPQLQGTKVTPAAETQQQLMLATPEGATLVVQPQGKGDAPLPASQSYKLPVTKSGKRLYACTDIGGQSCGAPVAASFCQQQGFAKAGRVDTQTEKVEAETLAGQLCDKKKCKVFKLIVCHR